MKIQLINGSCPEAMHSIPDSSVDSIICDPPYPCIRRSYGTMTEFDWTAMMHAVVKESRRILKTTGSAVFILQPNSKKLGSMRPWLFEFQAWCCHEWNMIQDVWWWNICAIPEAHSIHGKLCRPSLKACVWLGSPDCYRNQDAILWEESLGNAAHRLNARAERTYRPSGHSANNHAMTNAALTRGGVMPFNVLPMPGRSGTEGDSNIHGAQTPSALYDWWIRYTTPPNGTVCDPFLGSGTGGIVSVSHLMDFIGIERDKTYFDIASKRINKAHLKKEMFSIAW